MVLIIIIGVTKNIVHSCNVHMRVHGDIIISIGSIIGYIEIVIILFITSVARKSTRPNVIGIQYLYMIFRSISHRAMIRTVNRNIILFRCVWKDHTIMICK
jgi:hypothetical protein